MVSRHWSWRLMVSSSPLMVSRRSTTWPKPSRVSAWRSATSDRISSARSSEDRGLPIRGTLRMPWILPSPSPDTARPGTRRGRTRYRPRTYRRPRAPRSLPAAAPGSPRFATPGRTMKAGARVWPAPKQGGTWNRAGCRGFYAGRADRVTAGPLNDGWQRTRYRRRGDTDSMRAAPTGSRQDESPLGPTRPATEAAAKVGGWMDGFDTHVAITLDAGSV